MREERCERRPNSAHCLLKYCSQNVVCKTFSQLLHIRRFLLLFLAILEQLWTLHRRAELENGWSGAKHFVPTGIVLDFTEMI